MSGVVVLISEKQIVVSANIKTFKGFGILNVPILRLGVPFVTLVPTADGSGHRTGAVKTLNSITKTGGGFHSGGLNSAGNLITD